LRRKKGILKAYLESREKEVVDIMMILFNQEYAIDAYAEEIRQESARETARNLSDMGLTAEQIAQAVKVNVQQVWQWLEEGAVLAK